MADHANEAHGSSHPVNVAMGLCLIVAVGAAIAVVASAPDLPPVTEESFVLRAPTVDPARLAAERAKHYAEPDAAGARAELDALHAAVRAANEMQFGAVDGKSAHDAQIATVHHANELIAKIGMEAFVPAGATLYAECSAAFEKVLADVRAKKLDVETASTDPGPEHAAYRSACGNAFGPLLKSGVITADGNWTDPVSGPLVFEIMNRFRWASVLDLRRQPWQQLAPYEYEILTRWRASLTNVPVSKRVQWVVSASQTLPGFGGEELIGSLLLEQGDAVGALGAYEEACAENKRDLLLQRKCEFLRARVPKG